MLYVVGKIFLYGISFNIVYNYETFLIAFLTVQEKKLNLFKTDMEGHETALCCHTPIYLSNRTLQTQSIS